MMLGMTKREARLEGEAAGLHCGKKVDATVASTLRSKRAVLFRRRMTKAVGSGHPRLAVLMAAFTEGVVKALTRR